MSRSLRCLAAALVAFTAACSSTATGPGDETTGQLPRLTEAEATAPSAPPGPILLRIFPQALQRLAQTRGPAAAQEVAGRMQQLHAELQAAREAGNEELMRQKRHQIDHLAAAAALQAFGPAVAQHVLHHGHQLMAALQQRLAAAQAGGQAVPQPILQAAQQARQMLDAAREAAAAGQPMAVLIRAAQAADLLARLHFQLN